MKLSPHSTFPLIAVLSYLAFGLSCNQHTWESTKRLYKSNHGSGHGEGHGDAHGEDSHSIKGKKHQGNSHSNEKHSSSHQQQASPDELHGNSGKHPAQTVKKPLVLPTKKLNSSQQIQIKTAQDH